MQGVNYRAETCNIVGCIVPCSEVAVQWSAVVQWCTTVKSMSAVKCSEGNQIVVECSDVNYNAVEGIKLLCSGVHYRSLQ